MRNHLIEDDVDTGDNLVELRDNDVITYFLAGITNKKSRISLIVKVLASLSSRF
jgi:hypothetical protein